MLHDADYNKLLAVTKDQIDRREVLQLAISSVKEELSRQDKEDEARKKELGQIQPKTENKDS